MHRAEEIIQAVVANLDNLPTTGANITRSKIYDAAALPAISVDMGADSINEERNNMAFVDRDLEINITSYVKATVDADQLLNTIREEVYAAMMSVNTQGLAFVSETKAIGDDDPDISGDSNQPIGTQTMKFIVKYRHSKLNAGA